ncbi:hypothetical protein [Nocardioides dongkuii]|uniref:hypothetical protein n=1 Tax=Nocardioides dongkuii TaxID=2760089 RepID=UPI0015FB218D|nr:hypothetical protein [Nocardioides dongkuii]
MDQQPADSPYHRRLPIGERLSARPLVEDRFSSFEDAVLSKLEPMLVPEAPRAGELDRSECPHCRPSPHTIWSDGTWQVRAGFAPMGIPYVGGIAPHEHVRLEDAPVDLLAGLGPLMQRVSAAVKAIPGVARCHFGRWGDGSEHFHLWALARPAGMMQGRGAMLAFWDDVLPPLDDDLVAEHLRVVAEHLAAGGGEAFPAQTPSS